MRVCNSCGSRILDPVSSCPLCSNVLEIREDNDERSYPDVSERVKKITLLKRGVMFAGIVAIVLSGFVDFQMNRTFTWSVIVICAVFYAVFEVYMFLNPESGYQKRIFFSIIGGFILVFIIDVMTGFRGWSLDFVFPGAIFLANIGLLLLMLINRRNWQSYMIHQIGVILIGIIPIILIFTGTITHTKLSEVAFIFSVLLFAGTYILGGRVARMELQRRFHI